ncbi:MAG: radical SAM protein [Methanocellales archaeon]|nr:radical SAM protein [Methanocellales archaeon]
MKVVLATAPIRERSAIGEEASALYPPLGIMSLATYCRQHSPNVTFKLVDGSDMGIKQFVSTVNSLNPDVIGLSFNTVGAYGGYQSVNLLKQANQDVPILVGGLHVSSLPNEALQKSHADVVVIGEGEATLCELLSLPDFSPSTLKKVKGVAFRQDDKTVMTEPRPFIQDLDTLPSPDRTLLDIHSYPGIPYVRRKPETNMMASRGCPHNCVFCSHGWRTGRPYLRVRSPKNVVDEMEKLVTDYKIREIYEYSDEFNSIPSWSLVVCKEIKKRGLDFSWKAQVRADNLPESLVKSMSETGCWLVLLGIESGNPETLNGIRKGVTMQQVIDACILFKKYGIKIMAYFMVFNMWEHNGVLYYETPEMCVNTYRFAKKLLQKRLIDYLAWSVATPFPGSELYEITKRYDLLKNVRYDKWTAHDIVMRVPNVDEKTIKQIIAQGIMLQAQSLVMRGDINLRLFPFYMRRAFRFIKWRLGI